MKIFVKLFTTLQIGRFSEKEIETEEGSTIASVCRALDISTEQKLITLVNGRNAELDFVLSEGNTLAIFLPVGGG